MGFSKIIYHDHSLIYTIHNYNGKVLTLKLIS